MSTEMKRMDELTSRQRESALSTDEQVELDALLQRCPEARRRFVDQMLLENDLREDAATLLAESGAKTATTARHTSWFGWLAWRPLTAAAAGIVLGMFCTSMVFAYVAPSLGKVMTPLQEGFESGPAPLVTGVPIEAGKWSGDFTEIVGEQEGVRPAKGGKMLRFLSADYEGKSNAGPSRTASVWRLVDLRPYRREFGDGGAVAQLSAVLNSQAFPQGRSYLGFVQIHALDAEMAVALKERHWTELNASSLALTRSAGVALDRDPATWQRIDCEQRLPGNADFLLIEIGLKQMPKTSQSAEFAGHFLDDVRLTLARRPLLP
jgi:hypothetical protein